MWSLKHWKEDWAGNISRILSLAVLFFIVSLSFFSWRWSDDFCMYNNINKVGLWNFAWSLYTGWDGRGLMMGVTSGLAIKYLPVAAVGMLWTMAFIGSSYLIHKILLVEVPFLSKDKSNTIIQTAAVAVALWFGMSSHISETVYWSTGGYYILAAFSGLLWSYFMAASLKRPDGSFLMVSPKTLFFFAFSVLVGMFSHNLSTGLLGLGFISILIAWMEKGTRSHGFKYTNIGFFGVLIGTIIISAAPGNFVRASYGQKSFQLGIDAMQTNFGIVYDYYYSFSGTLIWLSILVGLLLTLLIRKGLKPRKEIIINFGGKVRIPFDKRALIAILEKIKYLIAALATIVPFVFVPDFGSPRTSIYFMVFSAIFILVLFTALFKGLFYVHNSNGEGDRKKTPIIAYIFLWGLFIWHLTVIVPHNVRAYEIHNTITKREEKIANKKNQGEDVVVKKLQVGAVPFSLKFDDISSDGSDWKNTCMAEYYGLKSISVKK